MPMDPREFQRRVTEHFKNVTEEEFLSNLRKSSPYLFIKDSEKQNNFVADNHSELGGEAINSLPIAFGTSCGNVLSEVAPDPCEAIDLSTPKPIDDHLANQNNIAIADQVTELPNGKLGDNGHNTNAKAKLDVEINEDWLKENATPELLQKIYDYLPDAEKKKA
jgi:hypothetical protein